VRGKHHQVHPPGREFHFLAGGKLHRALHDHHRGAGPDRIGDETVTVGPLAGEGDEAAARDDMARVNRGAGEGGDARRPEETGAGGGQEVVELD